MERRCGRIKDTPPAKSSAVTSEFYIKETAQPSAPHASYAIRDGRFETESYRCLKDGTKSSRRLSDPILTTRQHIGLQDTRAHEREDRQKLERTREQLFHRKSSKSSAAHRRRRS